VDVGHVLSRRDTARALGRLEQAVAAAAGVAQVFTAAGARGDPGYRALLEALAAHAAAAGPAGGGGLGEVSLQVVPPAAGAGAGAGFGEDAAQGCLSVPVDAVPGEVYAFAAARGRAVLAGLQAVREREAEVAAAAASARGVLRLRHLVRGGGVSGEQYSRCCRELRVNAATLLPLLEGLSVCVGERNGLLLERGMLVVAWDFEL
jgi:hypothetical protein